MTQPTTPDRIATALREADRMLREGRTATEVAAALGVSEATYHRWRRRFDGMKPDEIERLKELERENARLRRILADKELENEALREVARGRW
jgi:putative transposase